MEFNVIFYGHLSPFLEETAKEVEARELGMCFHVEGLSEYRQTIGQMSGGDQKSLTLFSRMKAMSECYEAGKSHFSSGDAFGLLAGTQRPMHPLVAKKDSGLAFYNEADGPEGLLEKIEIFFAMGALSVESEEDETGAARLSANLKASASVIDTQSRQFIERLSLLEPEPRKEKEKRQAAAALIEQGGELNYADLFAAKTKTVKDPSIDRKVKTYLGRGGVSEYTEARLKESPDAVEALEAREERYYPPNPGVLKYFPMLAEMIGKDDLERIVIQKLAALVLGKEYQCQTEFYKLDGNKVVSESGIVLDEEAQEPAAWNLDTPNWEDETFEAEDNVFILPYYFDGKCRGFARAVFEKEPIDHDKAAAIETVLSVCKGAYKT